MKKSTIIALGLGLLGTLFFALCFQDWRPLTVDPGDSEKDYLAAALTLIHENDTAMREVSQAIAQDDMHDLRQALDLAKTVLALSFGTYLHTSVPPQYQALDRKLRDSLSLRKDGLDEMLLYWQDYRQLHIIQAVKTLSKAVVLDNASLKIINSGLDQLVALQRALKTPPQ
jgi:hypothetical protein